MTTTLKVALCIWSAVLFAFAEAQATVIVTYEQAGVKTSSASGAPVYTFDKLSAGVHTDVAWSGVGTFDEIYVTKADEFGGAGNTKYAVEGLGVVSQSTLTLNTANNYFGLWLSAVDNYSVLDFYSGKNGSGTLLAEFTANNLLTTLSSAYYGNPNTGKYHMEDSDEAFAYINFFATKGSAWQSIVFTSTRTISGFEADNYTSSVAAIPLTGTVLETIEGTTETLLVNTPEPNSALALGLLCGACVGGPLFQRFRRKRSR